ncbi:hypothetical protein CHLRE_08g363874v5 [Chlamydomonas reinhardtii]|uniref:Alpha-glucan water dikinase phosphohistidine-like domain-containing protein n=1 Tax=Chlamydomonas reinhardtii TaxID=3055 RepID=A0A2K3DGQ2_CHLRE|nr:uncharacterized protein CHLRE_08g363874v5 [Chlamydomonas reinhardtii]PNW79708.1 hypothetical protein CHLRE_08g363874v5 [Chlamydomonas reinhardtii]
MGLSSLSHAAGRPLAAPGHAVLSSAPAATAGTAAVCAPARAGARCRARAVAQALSGAGCGGASGTATTTATTSAAFTVAGPLRAPALAPCLAPYTVARHNGAGARRPALLLPPLPAAAPAAPAAAANALSAVPVATVDEVANAEVRMSTTAERAAASCALGPAVAARMQADCVRAVRSWCKMGYGDPLVVHVDHQHVSSTSNPGLLTSAAVTFAGPDGRRHAAVAIMAAFRCPPPTANDIRNGSHNDRNRASGGAVSSPSRTGSSGNGSGGGGSSSVVVPGSSAPSLDPLPGLSLHWGCCQGPGQRWNHPGPGWHTQPGVSYDAGKGAWQTPMAVRQALPLDGHPLTSSPTTAGGGTADGAGGAGGGSADGAAAAVPGEAAACREWAAAYSAVLQLPWEGPIKAGGICLVLKTARNQWFKARTLPAAGSGSSSSGGGGADVDFWVSTSGLSLVAQGTPLLPDVFRMTHNDSLPAVARVEERQRAEQEAVGEAEGRKEKEGGGSGKGGSAMSSGDGTDQAAALDPATPPQPDLLAAAAAFLPPPRHGDSLLRPADKFPLPHGAAAAGPGAPRPPVCGWMVDHIAQREPGAERSLMHRYNAGSELVQMAGGSGEAEAALAALTAWLRLSAARLLVWNRNYNVKPREISTAQGRLASLLAALGAARGPSAPGGRGSAGVGALVRVALAAVGRGGGGEVGQRIRDEILAIQQRNGCKGGMMEEWHQKLHNNTSPDDVVICRALLDYIAAGLDITAYWRTLAAAGISAQRLAGFDRPITSEPRFSGQQAAGLQRDLAAYLQTLQAVHGGDDLRSAVNAVLGYSATDMKGKHITVPPLSQVATPALATHLRALLALQQHLLSPAGRGGKAGAAGAGAGAAGAGGAGASGAGAGAGAAGASSFVMGGAAGDGRATTFAKGPAAATAAAAGVGAGAGSLPRPADVSSLSGLAGAVRLMEMCVEARHLIKPCLDGGEAACGGRLVDVVFLDLALDSALRTAIEAHIADIKKAVSDGTAIHIAASASAAKAAAATGGGTPLAAAAAASSSSRPVPGAYAASAALGQALEVVRLAAENAALSCVPNDDLVHSNKWLRLLVAQDDPRDAKDRMLQALAICDRLKRSLAEHSGTLMALLQPPADTLAARLGIAQAAVGGIGEEVVRGSSSAPLAQLLACLEPALRRATGGGVWQVVSRGGDRPVVAGRLRLVPRLEAVQHEVMAEPTVLLVEGLTGAEEIPEGCVAVLVGSAAEGGGSSVPDVLSHSAVRARNMGVLLAGCHCAQTVARISEAAGSRVMLRLEGADVQVSFSSGSRSGASSASSSRSSSRQ